MRTRTRSGTAKRDPRIDAYIAGAAPFAKPIITQVREWMADGKPRNWKYMKK